MPTPDATPPQVFVTDAYVSITADVIIQRLKVGRRRSLLQRAREKVRVRVMVRVRVRVRG